MKEANCLPPCPCGEIFVKVDTVGYSTTWQCKGCNFCILTIVHPNGISVCVWIPQFHVRRGTGDDQRPIDDHTMAEAFVQRLLRNVAPTHAMEIDYGIETFEHFAALRFAIQAGISAYDLDRVMGDGQAITCLVRSVPWQPYYVEYSTTWDSDEDWTEEPKTGLDDR